MLTVVIPTYNRSKFLSEALESVLCQTYKDINILICDNCSTDNTLDIVKSYSDDRIFYHRHPTNIGMQRNWRFALTQPKTRYVALLEDDNLWLPEHLEKAMRTLESVSDAIFYSCTTLSFGDIEGRLHYPYWCHGLKESACFKPNERYARWLRGTPMAASSVVIKRTALDSIFWGGPDWPWCMDYLYWGQLALRGLYCFNPTVQVKYRCHSKQLSAEFNGTTRATAEYRYTVLTLANMAVEMGVMTARDLLEEANQWPAGLLSNLVVTLSDPAAHPELRQVAKALFGLRKDLKSAEASRHCQLAGKIGRWYLQYSSRLDRWLAGWHPKIESS